MEHVVVTKQETLLRKMENVFVIILIISFKIMDPVFVDLILIFF